MGNEREFGGTSNRRVSGKSEADPALRDTPPTMTNRDGKSDLGSAPDLLKPAKPDSASTGEFQSTGPVWWIGLDNDQTHGLSATIASGEGLAPLAGPLWPIVAGELAGSIGYIE